MHPRLRSGMAVSGIVASVATAGCGNLHGRPSIERTAQPPAAGIAQSAAAPQVDTVIAPGIVEPWGAQVNVSAQESGWIADILVTEGQSVDAGQTLARLADDRERHALDLSRADVREAEAALVRVRRGATNEERRQAQADYEAAEARRALAAAERARSTYLKQEGLIATDAYERTAADFEALAATAARAAARLAEVERDPLPEDLDAAVQRVAAARARMQLAGDALRRRQVVAPQRGTVLLSRMHRGEYASSDAGPLFVLGDTSRLQVRLEVDEIDAFVPVPGAACAIHSDDGVRLAEGRIVRLAPRMGRRALPLESPTARADVRVREVFVEVPGAIRLVPNQRVWGHIKRMSSQNAAREQGQGPTGP